MPQNTMPDLTPSWPQPDASGRCVLKAPVGTQSISAVPWLLLAAAGCVLMMVAAAGSAASLLVGFCGMVVGAWAGLSRLWRMLTGADELVLDGAGFTLRGQWFGWAEIGGFMSGGGQGRGNVTFTVAGQRHSIANIYGVTGAELAAFLNRQAASPAPAPDFMPPLPVRRKTLPFGAWVAIGAICIFLLVAGGPMAETVWQFAAPANYAGHTLNDQELTDKAGFDPSLLPVLLARAQAGDKSAMYHYGDVFDPTDFTCETAVPKDASVSVYWYRRAVALDDQGAERALGNLYRQGLDVPRDDVMAAALLERAVAHNDDFGDYYLGQMLEAGQGEPQNFARAAQLEEASAAQGNALGETELGRMYFAGIGVAQDAGEAAKYWHQAAAQRDNEAKTLLAQHGMP